MTETEQWVVHVAGPDDVMPQPDRATAYRVAHSINAGLLALGDEELSNSLTPTCWAVPRLAEAAR